MGRQRATLLYRHSRPKVSTILPRHASAQLLERLDTRLE